MLKNIEKIFISSSNDDDSDDDDDNVINPMIKSNVVNLNISENKNIRPTSLQHKTTKKRKILRRSSLTQIFGRVHEVELKNLRKQEFKSEKVALKFMRNRHQFLCELNIRKTGKFDSKFVIGVITSYDGNS
jgi:hypothetical protein